MVPAAQRLRFLPDFGYATGLRAGELVGVVLGGIINGTHGEQWLHLTGKGATAGKMVLPPLALFALDKHLMQRGLPVSPARRALDTPLLGHIDEPSGATTPCLRKVLRRFFRTAANTIQADHPSLADKVWRATPRWSRHTHATHALIKGATLTTVRDILRYASITTTSIYLDDEVERTRRIGRNVGGSHCTSSIRLGHLAQCRRSPHCASLLLVCPLTKVSRLHAAESMA